MATTSRITSAYHDGPVNEPDFLDASRRALRTQLGWLSRSITSGSA